METAHIAKVSSREKDTKKSASRRSLNPGKSSDQLCGESNGKRVHASEAFQAVGAQSITAENSDAVIASLSKHRLPKSNSKSQGKKSSVKKADQSKTRKNTTEAQTIPDDQKQIEVQEKVSEVPIKVISDSVEEDENKPNIINTRSKVKLQQMSKSKGKAGRETSSENVRQKSKTPSKTTQKGNTKSVAKSAAKSAAKSTTKISVNSDAKSKEKSISKGSKNKNNPDSLKRARIDTDLTNEEQATGAEEIKSVKKSVQKSKGKSKQSK